MQTLLRVIHEGARESATCWARIPRALKVLALATPLLLVAALTRAAHMHPHAPLVAVATIFVCIVVFFGAQGSDEYWKTLVRDASAIAFAITIPAQFFVVYAGINLRQNILLIPAIALLMAYLVLAYSRGR